MWAIGNKVLSGLTRLWNSPAIDQISTDMHFKTLPLQTIAEHLGDVRLEGDPATEISGVAGLREAGPGQLSFLSNPQIGRAHV